MPDLVSFDLDDDYENTVFTGSTTELINHVRETKYPSTTCVHIRKKKTNFL